MKTTETFATVSRDSDAWGINVSPDDAWKYSNVIIEACELAGINCYCDERPPVATDDGSDRLEFDWFNEWCNGSHEWTAEQWAEWFKTSRKFI